MWIKMLAGHGGVHNLDDDDGWCVHGGDGGGVHNDCKIMMMMCDSNGRSTVKREMLGTLQIILIQLSTTHFSQVHENRGNWNLQLIPFHSKRNMMDFCASIPFSLSPSISRFLSRRLMRCVLRTRIPSDFFFNFPEQTTQVSGILVQVLHTQELSHTQLSVHQSVAISSNHQRQCQSASTHTLCILNAPCC